MKLNHYLASAGICSRRKAVELIKAGEVTVNGTVVQEPWFEVTEKHKVMYHEKVAVVSAHKIYVLLNKPKDYITTISDERGRRTVIDLLPEIKERLFPVGRLDRMTTGLLVLTNDGAFAQHLAHPRYALQKVYQVMLDKPLEDKDFVKIQKGMVIEGERIVVDNIMYTSPRSRLSVRVTIHSGQNRIIRKIFEKFGYDVVALDRVAYGFLSQRGLSVGRWRYLTPGEVKRLLGTGEQRHERTKNVLHEK